MSDDKYIKMIISLPEEFFEGWEWNAGDRAITLTSHREIMIVSNPSMRQYSDWGEAIFPYSDDNTHDLFKKTDISPLPTQKQLQEKSTLDWWTFYSAIVHKSDIKYGKDESCECACLRQCVWILYGKKWNGEKWE
jgi:hypothetical protein